MVKQQVAEQINENKTSFVQDNTVINERIAVEASSNQNSVTQNVLQTESVEYSLETKKPKVYRKVEQTPEEIKMAKTISSNAPSLSFNEYDAGESFCIMYKFIENDELLKLISEDDIIYLSDYKDGDTLEYGFEEYIYNNTDTDITIDTTSIIFGIEQTNSYVIEKGTICGFDHFIDTAVISYGVKDENGSNQISNNENVVSVEKTSDNTIAPKILPKAGIAKLVIYIIIAISFVSIIISIKLKIFKDVK